MPYKRPPKIQTQEPLNAPFPNGLFSHGIFKRENGPSRHSGKRPITVGKRPIKEGKRPINANGLFSGTRPWWKTTPLKRSIKRSMTDIQKNTAFTRFFIRKVRANFSKLSCDVSQEPSRNCSDKLIQMNFCLTKYRTNKQP